MSGAPLSPEQLALRERQGAGARYDADAAPHAHLDLARRGTAYFARRLMQLDDADLDAPSLLPGWTRRHLVAHVGYNARAVARLVEWARTGVENRMYASDTQRWDEIVLGATLPTRALRHLVDHAAVHLDVEWRDLTDAQWDAEVVTAQGRTVPARETAWMRAKEVWVHAVDLDNGGSFLDFPPEMVDGIVADVLRVWTRRSEPGAVVLRATDRDAAPGEYGEGGPVVEGAAADLARWLAGRGARRLRVVGGGELPAIARWF
ncbi:maleylpyruvate isomerase family mycothiol-dependent enzyme [Microbacterium sp. SORGH_AS_0421]|uniref:maleylpyruvate isomerase family mycothiol-dependent enzyme n=1 Tax=Microbacterium sp. SORGH_AS_0421 TaxID=3041768 RepID=UPI002794929F|nr:maleylpyruvate isomerase family mycothiol-dependent enzyme [Microbacterium sp. SORGH_AS_0421]MDQ1177712.1 maleylpyruvate isomerase [Microbacterium sp. SORGH_AS_0421]